MEGDIKGLLLCVDELVTRIDELTQRVNTLADCCNLLQDQLNQHLRDHSMMATIPDPAMRSMAEDLRKLQIEIAWVRNLLPAKP